MEAKLDKPIVVDADGLIIGRLASRVAKMLLNGYRVIVVNSEKALISGKRSMIIREYKERLRISSRVHPRHGPFHPRRPDRMLTKMIRGMVPRRTPHGIQAMKRLRVYIGVPEEYAKVEKIKIKDALPRKPLSFYTRLGEVAKEIGWKGLKGEEI